MTAKYEWIGGLRERANASWPFCRLRIHDDLCTLEPTWGWLAIIEPTYEFTWDDIDSVFVIRGAMFGSTGIRFKLKQPVAAKRQTAFAKLWPHNARHPIFWCSPKMVDLILRAVPEGLVERNSVPPRVII